MVHGGGGGGLNQDEIKGGGGMRCFAFLRFTGPASSM